jgi:hypothetical protein
MRATTRAFKRPKRVPIIRVIKRRSMPLSRFLIDSAIIIAQAATCPTERSMPPESNTKASPIAITSVPATLLNRPLIFPLLRNLGLTNVKTTHILINMSKIAKFDKRLIFQSFSNRFPECKKVETGCQSRLDSLATKNQAYSSAK